MTALRAPVGGCRITVAVCTHNRHDRLAECIASLGMQDIDPATFEILVLDNSTDTPARDAYAARARHPDNLRTITLPTPGLATARNVALREAKAPLIAYIDDDAIAEPGWIPALLDAFARHPKVDVVFGPVIPIWPGAARPDWIDPAFEAAFTVLDLGSVSRLAKPQESGFGANLAFRVEALRHIGGFPENLGRIRGALLSGEELAVQTRLRQLGSDLFYAAAARVRHHVGAERLRLTWLLARFAWQAVSDRLEGVPWSGANDALSVLARSPHGDAAGRLLASLGNRPSGDGSAVAGQVAAVRALVGVLLAASDLDDPTFARTVAGLQNGLGRSDAARHEAETAAAPRRDPYRWAPSIGVATRLAIVEGMPGHPYLARPFMAACPAQLVEVALHGFARPSTEYPGLFAALRGRGCQTLFLTLDSHVYWINGPTFLRALDEADEGVWGIVHRLPADEHQAALLRQTAARLTGLFVLAEEMVSVLRDRYGIVNAHYLPHPAMKAPLVRGTRADLRRKLGIPEGRIVVSFLGEVRVGKGFGLLLDALEGAGADVRDQIHFLFGGRASRDVIARCRAIVQRKGLSATIDLAEGNGSDYAVLADSDFADRLAATDWLLLLYNGPQRDCMSGALSDILSLGGRIIATRDSLVGRLTAQIGGGVMLDTETPEALASLLSRVVHGVPTGVRCDALDGYLAAIRPEMIVKRIRAVMNLVPSGLERQEIP